MIFLEENSRCDNLKSNIHAVCDRLKLRIEFGSSSRLRRCRWHRRIFIFAVEKKGNSEAWKTFVASNIVVCLFSVKFSQSGSFNIVFVAQLTKSICEWANAAYRTNGWMRSDIVLITRVLCTKDMCNHLEQLFAKLLAGAEDGKNGKYNCQQSKKRQF